MPFPYAYVCSLAMIALLGWFGHRNRQQGYRRQNRPLLVELWESAERANAGERGIVVVPLVRRPEEPAVAGQLMTLSRRVESLAGEGGAVRVQPVHQQAQARTTA